MVLNFNSAIAKINRAMATIKLKFDYSLQDFLNNFKKHEYSNDVQEVTVKLFDKTKIDHFYSQVNEIIRVALKSRIQEAESIENRPDAEELAKNIMQYRNR